MKNLILCLIVVFNAAYGTEENYKKHQQSLQFSHDKDLLQSSYKGMATYVDTFNAPSSVLHNNHPVLKTYHQGSKYSYNEYHSFLETLRRDLGDISKTEAFMKSSQSPSEYSDIFQCQADLTTMLNEASNGTTWALQMLDAWGKPGSGILNQQVQFLGNFDECLETKTGQNFGSQYCLEMVYVSNIGPVVMKQPASFGLGVCAPSSCSAPELGGIFELYLSSLRPNVTAGVYYSECKDTNMPLTDKAKAVIAVCSVFAALLLFATLYDIIVVHGIWMLFSPTARSNTIWLGEPSAGDSIKENPEHRSEYEPLLDPKNVEHYYIPGTLGKILLSFSVYTNGGKLLSTKTGSGSIECINGIRFISMTWVILGHTYVMGLQGMDNVQGYLAEAYTRWTFQGILSALVSVDTFFALSGLLMTYLIMKELDKTRPGGSFFFQFYFHRFWRLTPPYMLVMMTYIPLFKYIGDGPVWPQQGAEKDECEGTWWTNLLYVNNIVKDKEMCMGWSWYLANDMQFFVISPIIFLPLFRFGKKALFIPLAMLVGNAICAGVISVNNDLPPNIDILNSQGNNYFNYYYIKPYTRIGPYLIGMMTGYFLYLTECRARMNRTVVIVGWCLAWTVALAVVYGLYYHTNGHPLTSEIAALYNALHRIGWAMALCWLIFACANGYGGFINTILSWKGFVPLSRLTYCAYLVHPLVIYFYYFSHRKLFYLDNNNVIFAFLGTLVVSYAVAFVASMAYEAPMLGLEKSLIGSIGRTIRGLIKKSLRRVNSRGSDNKRQQYSTM